MGRCPECGRTVTLVNARYEQRAATLRAHYPEPVGYYESHRIPVPAQYCPGRKP